MLTSSTALLAYLLEDSRVRQCQVKGEVVSGKG